MNASYYDILSELISGDVAYCWFYDKVGNLITLLLNENFEYEILIGQGKGQFVKTFKVGEEDDLAIEFLEKL